MKAILLGSSLMLAVTHPAQAQQAYLNYHHLVTTSEERMVDALNAATKTGKQHPEFCLSQHAANYAIAKWLQAAETCRTRMADYENRVAQAVDTKRLVASLILVNCKLD